MQKTKLSVKSFMIFDNYYFAIKNIFTLFKTSSLNISRNTI